METENELIRLRRERVEALRAAGINPYPDASVFETDTTTGQFKELYGEKSKEELESIDTVHRIAGRAKRLRGRGKLFFVPLLDRDGELQVFLSKKSVPEELWARFKDHVQEGDFIGVVGTPMRTNTGELSIAATEVHLLSKGVRQLPEKYHGLKDKETRYRQRYVDLIANPEVAEVFKQRSKIIRYMRNFFDSHDFLEVETPMMHPLAGGAAARPFTTHHNALDMELYMRIAPELYLKRLVVGSLERVYEINRNFRNEGLSLQHNPEFTMLEFYCAYWTYHRLMDLTEELISGLVEHLHGTTKITYHPDPNDRDGEKPIEEWESMDLEFARPWKRATMWELLAEHGVAATAFEKVGEAFAAAWEASDTKEASARHGLSRRLLIHLDDAHRGAVGKPLAAVADAEDPSADALHACARAMDGALDEATRKLVIGDLLYAVFEEKVEPTLIQPQFVTRFPLAVSPLARKCDDDPSLTDRFELFIAGREIANAFSELNDPADQKARFEAQVVAKDHGDDEAMDYDADYVRALEYGLPPTAGEGIGIDRLVMLLTDQASIRDVILFPLLRREK